MDPVLRWKRDHAGAGRATTAAPHAAPDANRGDDQWLAAQNDQSLGQPQANVEAHLNRVNTAKHTNNRGSIGSQPRLSSAYVCA